MRPLFYTLLALILGDVPAMSAALRREANTTLSLPSIQDQYTTVDAFPGLVFDDAMVLATPPGETNILFVAERVGTIRVITNLASPDLTLFLDITDRVVLGNEGGLLGLAFHPGYATNRSFFVFYTVDTATDSGAGYHNRLARFQRSDDPWQALSDSETPLITQYDESTHHNAGDIHFGADGYLYLSLGDEGFSDDAWENTRYITRDFFAGILRLDVDQRPGNLPPNPHPASSGNYAVPDDNPFIGATNFNGFEIDPATVRTEFWAVGLRNPFRFSFDLPTGRLFCGDVGSEEREEINLIRRGGNYGWNYREGLLPFPPAGEPPPNVSFIDPILDYPHGFGPLEGHAVIGGIVYRGARTPSLYGHYLFADHVSGNIWAFQSEGENVSNWRRLTGRPYISSLGRDPSNGDLLMTCLGGTETFERIYRLVSDTNAPAPQFPETLADTGAFTDLAALQPTPGIVPYEVNTPFWSDYAIKQRWFSLPDTNLFLGFDPWGNWSFPTGTVWIKHFEIELTNGVPASRRRLETRFLVKHAPDAVYGITYKWDRPDNATLLPEDGLDETLLIYTGSTVRTQVWHYPARTECLACHTPQGGYALGFNSPQLNRSCDYSGFKQNQLEALSEAGYFETPLTNQNLPEMSHPTNTLFSTEDRVRSYFAANCAQCHNGQGGPRGLWDARFAMALSGIVNGKLVNNWGDPLNRVVAPGSLLHSVLFQRVANLGAAHMPPLGTSEIDMEAINLLRDWITVDLVQKYRPIIMTVGRTLDQCQLQFRGAAIQDYNIESSADLLNWDFAATVRTDETGLGSYQKPFEAFPPANFFRVVWR